MKPACPNCQKTQIKEKPNSPSNMRKYMECQSCLAEFMLIDDRRLSSFSKWQLFRWKVLIWFDNINHPFTSALLALNNLLRNRPRFSSESFRRNTKLRLQLENLEELKKERDEALKENNELKRQLRK